MRFIFLFLPLISIGQTVNFQSSNLPIILINTNGQTITDEPKITANMKVIDNGPGQINKITDPANGYNGPIGIEIRGNTSTLFSDKKPYSVEIRDAEGEDLDIPLLGMPEGADWVFMAPFSDKSLIRDALALELARRIMPWASRTRYVEVVLNGNYQGIYLVAEKIERDKDRVNIAKLKSTDVAGDSLTGGYIIKIDKVSGAVSDGWTSPFPPVPGAWQTTYIQYHYPSPANIRPEQKNYIEDWFTTFENAMDSDDFADTLKGYPKFVDVGSFIDYTLINEISKNVDAYRLSTFLYKDRDDKDPRLHAGPVWDFNIAFGNAGYCGGESTTGWVIDFNEVCPQDQWIIQYWWPKMWKDPAYTQAMSLRWKSLRQSTFSDLKVLALVDSLTKVVEQAQVRNFQRWPILHQWNWPNVFCCGSYADHVNYMRQWTIDRLHWMDSAMEPLYYGLYKQRDYHTTRVYPNPGSDYLIFESYVKYNAAIRVEIYDMRGNLAVDPILDPVFNGENLLKLEHSLAPGCYFYRVWFDNRLESKGTFVVH